MTYSGAVLPVKLCHYWLTSSPAQHLKIHWKTSPASVCSPCCCVAKDTDVQTTDSFLRLRVSSIHPQHSAIKIVFLCSIKRAQLAFHCTALYCRMTPWTLSFTTVTYDLRLKGLDLRLTPTSFLYSAFMYTSFLWDATRICSRFLGFKQNTTHECNLVWHLSLRWKE